MLILYLPTPRISLSVRPSVPPSVRYRKRSHRISQCIYDANIIPNVQCSQDDDDKDNKDKDKDNKDMDNKDKDNKDKNNKDKDNKEYKDYKKYKG